MAQSKNPPMSKAPRRHVVVGLITGISGAPMEDMTRLEQDRAAAATHAQHEVI